MVRNSGCPCARSRTPASPRRRCAIATPHRTEAAKEPKARGRHRSLQAGAALLKATLYLLERQPLRKVTADAIARRAGVSKTTIYKWWPNKSLVALDAYLAGMTEQVAMPDTGSAELDFTQQLKSVMAFYTSPLGRLFCQFLAEGRGPGRDSRRGRRRDCARPDLRADDFSLARRTRLAERSRIGGGG